MPVFSKLRYALRQTPRWLIGAAVVTPTLGFMQGVALLLDYRKYYGDAPYPVSPSQGLVVAVDTRSHVSQQSSIAQFLTFRKSSPPLRLLVIGDSLAAGVGVISRPTPVLPESIAKSLSQKLGGRPVYWTCIGRPGAVLQEIIQNIENHDKLLLDLSTKMDAPPQLPPTFKGRIIYRMHCIAEWWKTRPERQQYVLPDTASDSDQTHESDTSEKPGKRNRAKRWLSFVRDDIRLFFKACRGINEAEDDSFDSENHEEYSDDSDEHSEDSRQSQLWAHWKQRLRRRESLKEDYISEIGDYDIAVVLTGTNDLKHAWLPFMFKDHDNADGGKTFQEMLQNVVEALRARVRPILNVGDDWNDGKVHHDGINYSNQSNGTSENSGKPSLTNQKPVVVFPAIPITLVPQLCYVPMRWFVFAIFQRLENTKKELADEFPEDILFVDAPPFDLLAEIETRKGKFYEDLKSETVLLKLTNVTKRVQENFEKKAKEYRDRWEKLVAEQNDGNDSNNYNNHPDESYPDYEKSKSNKFSRALSVDQLHPSDEGYEIWGRHIAREVLKQWKPT